MGLFGKKDDNNSESNDEIGQGKYNEQCSVCGKAPTDKKWGGQYFHKKCFRRLKKMGKGMI
jgi:hypothetical protein